MLCLSLTIDPMEMNDKYVIDIQIFISFISRFHKKPDKAYIKKVLYK
ncbi:hypothetical protein FACS1894163_13690 [Spirochaetia bacterium]|nr:hypothetical protein FACS1894163_13690 [Spirochaetia bacterium]